MVKKILKSLGIVTGGIFGVAGIALTSLYFSETLTSKVLNLVKDKVPSISWSASSGSLSQGLVLHDFKFDTLNYKYNPQVAKPAEQAEVAVVPTLTEVTAQTIKTGINLSCLFKLKFCLEDIELEQVKVIVATGNKGLQDKYADNAYVNLTPADIALHPYVEPESGGMPSWLEVDLRNGRAKGFSLVLGKNIGLAQASVNQQLQQKLTAAKQSLLETKQNSFSLEDLGFKKDSYYKDFSYVATAADLSLNLPSSPYLNYLTAPMLINLEQLNLDHLYFNPQTYQVDTGYIGGLELLFTSGEQPWLRYQSNLSLAENGSLESGLEKITPLTEETETVTSDAVAETSVVATQAAAEQERLAAQQRLKSSLLPKPILELLKQYFALTPGYYSNAYKDLAKTNFSNVQATQEYSTEGKEFLASKGKLKATEFANQLKEAMQFVNTPLHDYLLTETHELKLPFTVLTKEVELNGFALDFARYNANASLGKRLNARVVTALGTNFSSDLSTTATSNKKALSTQTSSATKNSDSALAYLVADDKVVVAGSTLYQANADLTPVTVYSGFGLHKAVLSGDLSPQRTDVRLKTTGDVNADLSFNYRSTNQKLAAQAKVEIVRLPVVNELPVKVDAQLVANGVLSKDLNLSLENKSKNAQLVLQARLDTVTPQWPNEVKLSVDHLSLPNLTISPLVVETYGQYLDSLMKLNFGLTLGKKSFAAVGYINQQQNLFEYNLNFQELKDLSKLNHEVTSIAPPSGKIGQKPALDFAAQVAQINNLSKLSNPTRVDLAGGITLQENLITRNKLVVSNLSVLDFVSLADFSELKVNADLDFGAVINSAQDWSISLDNLTTKASINKQPLEAKIRILADSVFGLDIKELESNYLSNKLSISGKALATTDLSLKAKVNQLASLVKGLDIDFAADLHLKGSTLAPEVVGNLDLQRLNYRNASLDLSVSKLLAQLDLTVTDEFTGDSSISLAGVKVNGFEVYPSKLRLQGTPVNRLDLDLNSNQAHLKAKIEELALVDKKLSGLVSFSDLQVTALDLQPLSTSKPFLVKADLEAAKYEVGTLALGNKQLKLSSSKNLVYQANKLSGDLRVDSFNLNLLNPKLKEAKTNLEGVVSAVADFNLDLTNLEKPTNNLSLQLNSESIKVKQIVNYALLPLNLSKLNLKADLVGSNVNAQASLLLNQGKLLTNLNLRDLYKSQLLSGSLVLDRLSLDLIKPLLENTQQVKGYLASDLQLGGTLQEPLLYGKLGTYDLKVAMADLPFEVKAGELVTSFRGKLAEISGNLRTDSTPITLNGNVDWTQLNDIKGNVAIKSNNLQVKLLDYGKGKLNTEINLNYDEQALVVRGGVELHDANLQIASGSASYLTPSSDVVIINHQEQTSKAKKKPSLTAAPAPKDNIDVELEVKVGKNVNFDAFGAKANLAGGLMINYNPRALGIFGTINIVNGTVEAYGQNLIVQRGQVTFNGISPIPNIDIRAIRNPDFVLDNVTVGVQAQGLATKPNISLFSTPNMSQANKINYLLTGTSSSSGDGEVGLQLLSSTLTSSLGIIQQIGNAFGVKNLQLSTAKSGEDSQVTLSGTVFNRVRVNYAYGLFNGLTEISASYRLLPRVFLRLSHGLSSAIDAVYNISW